VKLRPSTHISSRCIAGTKNLFPRPVSGERTPSPFSDTLTTALRVERVVPTTWRVSRATWEDPPYPRVRVRDQLYAEEYEGCSTPGCHNNRKTAIQDAYHRWNGVFGLRSRLVLTPLRIQRSRKIPCPADFYLVLRNNSGILAYLNSYKKSAFWLPCAPGITSRACLGQGLGLTSFSAGHALWRYNCRSRAGTGLATPA
jgi:hypothetical protein